ncbi:hypothetical protein TIFTF001_050105 [Ficus carica]|uniref:Phorbol-ester/DAG-type domain-containing protein n=1 Tax=Ficus carica TaxID=3494 RepID=A0AA87ZAS3_FICCA|nr:hypothetical protein TIFTF001_050105 [Ficus carica]
MDQIQLWCHPRHPLFLRKDHEIDNVRCRICHEDIEAPYNYYACDACAYYVHKSCAELPPHINHHPFHPSHPLFLRSPRSNYCDSCHQFFWDALTFSCYKCEFSMDVECAMMPTITCEGREHIQHFTHQHPMPLIVDVNDVDVSISLTITCDVDFDDEIKCFVCHSTCSSGVVYGCTKCNHFLHKSCAELPQKVLHPLHPNHSLLNLRVQHSWFKCSVCHESGDRTLTFHCLDKCCGLFCVKCGVKCGVTLKGTIKYEDHEHLLCFLEDTYTKLAHCDGYDAYCKQPLFSDSTETDRAQLSILRCSNLCDFRVHVLCGPLPSTIRYEYHMHPLILLDSLVDDNSGEYCCDICESERDPRIRVYYCQDCKYVAHVHCLISEVRSL